MIDPVELKALLDWLAKTSAGHAAKASDFMMLDDSGSAAFHDQQAEKASEAATALLALSEEVERLKRELSGHINLASVGIDSGAAFRKMWTEMRERATSAEADAKALRQRLGEIREIAEQLRGQLPDMLRDEYALADRIAALAAIQDGEKKESIVFVASDLDVLLAQHFPKDGEGE